MRGALSNPASIVTRSTLVLRDLDLLEALAARNLTRVFISVTTLDDELKRRMEPRAASPAARLAALRRNSLAERELASLDTGPFLPPRPASPQLSLL